MGSSRLFMNRILLKINMIFRPYSKVIRTYVFTENPRQSFSDTFQFWILNSFRTSDKYLTHSSPIKTSIGYKRDMPDLSKFEDNEILDLINCRKSRDTVDNEFKTFVDKELTTRVQNDGSLEKTLKILDVCVHTFPKAVTSMTTYQSAMNSCLVLVAQNYLTIYQSLQIMYYASISKKASLAKKIIDIAVKKIEVDQLKLLNNAELGIFCNSFFRSGIVLPDRLLSGYILYHFKENISGFISEPAIFICLIKAFRHARCYNDELYLSIKKNICSPQSLSKFQLTFKVHLLTYFSDSLYADINLVTNIIKSCIIDMNHSISTKQAVRLKDIESVLWSATNYHTNEINCIIKESDISNYVYNKTKNAQTNPVEVMSIVAWLWVLDVSTRENLFEKLVKRNIKKIKGLNNFKKTAKLNLLLTCVAIEAPHLMTEDIYKEMDKKLTPRINKYLSARPGLEKIFHLVKKYSHELGIVNNISCEFLIPGLYIAGITVKDPRGIFSIEVFDETVCLRKSDELQGKMKLKLKLLNKLGIRTCIVDYPLANKKELTKEDLKELKQFLNIQ